MSRSLKAILMLAMFLAAILAGILFSDLKVRLYGSGEKRVALRDV